MSLQPQQRTLPDATLLTDLYEVLGVNNNVSAADIRSAYERQKSRSIADEYRPTDADLELANNVLGDTAKRSEYDSFSEYGQNFELELQREFDRLRQSQLEQQRQMGQQSVPVEQPVQQPVAAPNVNQNVASVSAVAPAVDLPPGPAPSAPPAEEDVVADVVVENVEPRLSVAVPPEAEFQQPPQSPSAPNEDEVISAELQREEYAEELSPNIARQPEVVAVPVAPVVAEEQEGTAVAELSADADDEEADAIVDTDDLSDYAASPRPSFPALDDDEDLDDDDVFADDFRQYEAQRTFQALLAASFFQAIIQQYMLLITWRRILERLPAPQPLPQQQAQQQGQTKDTGYVISPFKTFEEVTQQVRAWVAEKNKAAEKNKEEPQYSCKVATQNGEQVLLVTVPNKGALDELQNNLVKDGLLVSKEKSAQLQRQPDAEVQSFASRV